MAPLAGLALLLLPASARGRAPTVIATTLAVAAVIAVNWGHARPKELLAVTDADFTPERLVHDGTEVGWSREFLPAAVAAPPRATSLWGELQGEGPLLIRRPDFWLLEILMRRPGTVRLNLHWFPGWTVSDEGTPVAARAEPRTGRIEFDLKPGKHILYVLFRKTPVRAAADVLSLLGMVLWVAIPLWPRRPEPAAVPAC